MLFFIFQKKNHFLLTYSFIRFFLELPYFLLAGANVGTFFDSANYCDLFSPFFCGKKSGEGARKHANYYKPAMMRNEKKVVGKS